MTFESAERVADAVLYEGYLLYPYRASSTKNRVRWQFGVIAPEAFVEAGGAESSMRQSECVLDADETAELDIRFRFLQLRRREVEAPDEAGQLRAVPELAVRGRTVVPFDEAVDHRVDARVSLRDLEAGERRIDLSVPGGCDEEEIAGPDGLVRGRVVLERWPIAASATVSVKQVGRYRRLRVVVTNDSPMVDPRTERDVALRRSLLSAHWLLSVDGGRFVSLLDPPADAREAVAGCRNDGVWPVLVGQGDENDVVLVSPIILYDHPEIAPESAGDLFDATEIDEILTLRILTLTDEEKREARATDERARAIIERSEALPPEIFERLHGAVREVGLVSWSGAALEQPDDVPTFGADPFAVGGPFWEPTAGIEPDRASVAIGGVFVSRGSAVRLRPGPRGDTIDTFLAGRVGHVEAIFESVDEETYVAVTIDDDPAAELHAWYGRYFYFRPSELEPLDADDLAAGPPAASVTEQAR